MRGHHALWRRYAGRLVSMSVESFTPTALQFTHGAAHKVKSLVDEEGNDRLKLRVFVTGGGCSGFSVRLHLR
jgi:iron-sulfur cluster insertion protein